MHGDHEFDVRPGTDGKHIVKRSVKKADQFLIDNGEYTFTSAQGKTCRLYTSPLGKNYAHDNIQHRRLYAI